MAKDKRNIRQWVEAEYHIDADTLAEVFWAMDAEEQAYFFSKLAEESKGKLPTQLQYIVDSKHLTPFGRYAMQLIGDYGNQYGS